MRLRNLIAVVLLTSLLGCSQEPAAVPVGPPPVSPAKMTLDDISKSGQLGSGIMDVQTAIDNMKTTDAAKAGKLDAELKALQSETDPEKVKTKAKAMADQF